MSTQTLTAADAILKDLYVGPIVEQLNQRTYMIDQIQRDADHIDHTGRRAIVPVHSDRNHGRASLADGGTLPTAGVQAWQDAIINLRYHYAGIELSDVAIEATKSNQGAFISLLEAESKGVAQDLKKDINRQVFGQADTNNKTGLLGNCGTTTASLTVTLASSNDVQYIKINDVVDIRTQSTGAAVTNGTGRTVVARNVSAATITLDTPGGNVTTSTSEGVYLAGNLGNEMDGMRNITATGRTLHGINSSTAGNQFWDGNTLAAGGTAGESLFEQLADNVAQNGNGDVEVFVTTRGVRRRLANTYQSQKRFNDSNATKIEGGYTAIFVNEIPVVLDDDCPKGFAFGFNKDALRWFEQVGPGWLESNDGHIFQLKATGSTGQRQAVWQAWFKWYAALGCVAPNRTGRLTGCNDDNPV